MESPIQSSNNTQVEFSIHPATKVGFVALTVANLENQIDFYQNTLGFQLHWREAYRVGMGAGEQDLLLLMERSSAQKYHRVTGLYHFAIVFPNRQADSRRTPSRALRLGVRQLSHRPYPDEDHLPGRSRRKWRRAVCRIS